MRMFLLKCAILLAILVAGCAKPTLTPSSVEFSSARIDLLEITPPPGAKVDENAVIQAKLRYEINGFKPDPGRYRAKLMFEGTTPNQLHWFSYKTDGKFPGESEIRSRTGELQMNYPVEFIKRYSRKQNIGFPLRLRFVINETTEKDEFQRLLKSRIIAKTVPITYTPTFSRENEKAIGSEERSIQIAEPSLEIFKIESTPQIVQPGAKFKIVVTYTVRDPSDQNDRIPIQFTFKILKSGSVLFASGSGEVQALNGGQMSKTLTFTATKDPGRYDLEAALLYRGKTVRKRTPLEIK